MTVFSILMHLMQQFRERMVLNQVSEVFGLLVSGVFGKLKMQRFFKTKVYQFQRPWMKRNYFHGIGRELKSEASIICLDAISRSIGVYL
jgi:hypothetical protein